ncbi:putative RNA methyltransferase [Sporosarcina jiandibaonis]|uniref:putative RNA methyltransferase n=1 Tax=Sporosarcina jiandibaonis TaxID=2715535 RepID=UPI001556D984|nr:methyltransferase domain-containing protein [Sporosarcina jiandibaonis]
MISKKMMNAEQIEKNAHLFSCPVCGTELILIDKSRLVCTKNHSFDLSRQGYVNLTSGGHLTKYDKALFEARKTIIDSGFFNPVLDSSTNLISKQLEDKLEAVIIDAGCGEGSHLSTILSKLRKNVTGVGIDLSKEGILAAAKDHPGNIWAVADLANCPFADEQFDVILNILSPANYAEFTRLLKPDGLFLKVVPEQDYLKELRAVFYDEAGREQDADPAARVAEHFSDVKTERITYQFPLDQELLAKLIRMTPLTWGASGEKVNEALRIGIPSITIDFTIIIATQRNEGAFEC